MLARIRKAMDEREEGFTLIELLVVMIIIGILAAIAIPVFLSQRAKAQDSAAKADVSTIGKEVATYYVDGTGIPVVASDGTTTTTGRYSVNAVDVGKQSSNVFLNGSVGPTTGSGAQAAAPAVAAPTTGWTSNAWCVGVLNANGSQKTYKYSAQNGLEPGQCTSASTP